MGLIDLEWEEICWLRKIASGGEVVKMRNLPLGERRTGMQNTGGKIFLRYGNARLHQVSGNSSIRRSPGS
ncbi:UNVERIFIED_CONTAM: hypothetical protein PYX00_006390 [Menopon gallinae]|uniref:Uncharacterized protein n=1 Tax=Menopon gallinae TaxID=328185 RepID=A0AAW2HVD2_9NEOP